MLNDSLRRKLEQLNSERGKVASSPPSQTRSPRPATAKPASKPTSSHDQLFGRGHEVETPMGNHWRIVVPLDELWPNSSPLIEGRLSVLKESQVDTAWQPLLEALPDGISVLDLETCGLGGSALFLVGLLRQIDGELAVELLLARNYAEEAAVLASMWDALQQTQVLLTYNGKSFDWPTVNDRTRRWLIDRQRTLPAPQHYDLLHPARRKWKSVLPDCRLLTIEQQICRRQRHGDIAGRDIPAAYEQFARTGEPQHIGAILYHNALDVTTLLDLSLRLIE